MYESSAAYAAALVSLIALAGCAADIVPPEPAPHVSITGGNEQAGTALDTLALPLEIALVDDEGKPVGGRTVVWSTDDVAGRLIPQAATTDATGRARAVWILGFNSGAQAASATVTGEDEAVQFNASATPVLGFKAIALMQGSTGASPAPNMCALDADGLAWCWGGNAVGQLGDGTTTPSVVPRKVAGDMPFVSIHGDGFNTCALRESGELWCWGLNRANMVSVFADGSLESSSIPVRAAPSLLFRDFDLEVQFACGVTLDGRGFCWGDGDGAWGNGTEFAAAQPAEIVGGPWLEIAVGDDSRCAISEEHVAHCWLDPDFDRWTYIGVPDDAGPDDTPLAVEIAGQVADLGIGEFGPCGISLAAAGTGICWGIGASDAPPGPSAVRPGSSVRRIVSDGFGRAALDAEGQLWVWGGGCGQSGCGPAPGRTPPILLFPGIAWSDISIANGLHAISARDGVVFSLGAITDPADAAAFELVPVPLP